MPQQHTEAFEFLNSSNQIMILIDNQEGTILFRDSSGRDRMILNNEGELKIIASNDTEALSFASNKGDLIIGGKLNPGKIYMMDGKDLTSASIVISGDTGGIYLGSPSNAGGLYVNGENGVGVISLNGHEGTLNVRKNQNGITLNKDGDITCKFENREVLRFAARHAALYLGSRGSDGDIVLRSNEGVDTITLDGNSGNITCNDCFITGADFAEDFDIAAEVFEKVEPGTVMVFDKYGCLVESYMPYDNKAVGIISGAGKYRPGIVLDKQPAAPHRLPVALSGKVMCKVDATYGEIEIGDLLTTSETRGFAMKATDQGKAFGSVIGKALGTLKSGKGLIPVLVSLQ